MKPANLLVSIAKRFLPARRSFLGPRSSLSEVDSEGGSTVNCQLLTVFSNLRALVLSLPRVALAQWGLFALVVLSFFFLLPNQQPVSAVSCSIDKSSMTQAGGSLRVSGSGFGNNNLRIGIHTGFATNDTTLGFTGGADPLVNKLVNIPSNLQVGTWFVFIDLGGFGKMNCQPSLQITSSAPSVSCSYTFNSTVAAGGTVSVNINSTGLVSPGSFTASITPTTPLIQGTQIGNTPLTINLTVPSSTAPGNYIVAARLNPSPLCSTASSSLTITGLASTWTITDPPTQSGSNITFNWSPAANSAMVLRIWDEDDPLKTVVWNSNAKGVSIDGKTSQTVSTTTWDVNPAFPIDGRFGVTLVTFSPTPIANSVIFTISGAPPPPPPGGDGNYAVAVSKIDPAAGCPPDIGSDDPAILIACFSFPDFPGGVKDGITTTSHTFDPGSLPSSTQVAVFVCKINCGPTGGGKYDGWTPNPKTCTTGSDGSLTVDWGNNTCSNAATECFEKMTRKQDLWPVIGKGYICTNTFDSFAFANHSFAGVINSMVFHLFGEDEIHPEINGITKGTGALSASGNLVAGLFYAPPVSGVEYFAGLYHQINPVKDAYAQAGGIGYQALAPVQKIWTAFRNISYVGFVVVFVIIGFMIMFRAHISPQAVATIQDSIPRIVIALILVTFSYAIAGLMIDLMFLFLNIVINALQTTGLLTDKADTVFQKSVFGVVFDSWRDIVATVYHAIRNIIGDVVQLPFGLDWVIAQLGGSVVGLVFGIAILFIMFRVFLMLLMAYVMIVVMTIAAPFYFLIQALPGNNGAREWFRQMVSNVAVFPATALMFLLAGIIAGIGDLGAPGGPVLTNQEVGQFPLLAGGIKAADIGKLIGLGVLLMTPTAAELVRNAIGVKGGGAGASFAPGMAALGASAGFLGRRAAESSPGQALSTLAKYGGERRSEALINKAPGFLRGNKKLTLSLPTLRERGGGTTGGSP